MGQRQTRETRKAAKQMAEVSECTCGRGASNGGWFPDVRQALRLQQDAGHQHDSNAYLK